MGGYRFKTPRSVCSTIAFAASIFALTALFLLLEMYQSGVHFPDPGLDSAIRSKLHREKGSIKRTELAQITELDARYRKIKDLSGIQRLYRLERLSIEGNEIRDVAPLRHLHRLVELNCSNNAITNLYEAGFGLITALPLRSLDLRNNHSPKNKQSAVKLSDVSLLCQIRSLEKIVASGNGILDISWVSSLKHLASIRLEGNVIEDASPLSALTNLREINLRDNQLSSIEGLGSLNSLRELNLQGNHRLEGRLEELRGLAALEVLDVDNIPLGKSPAWITGLTNLLSISARNAGIDDPSPFVELMKSGALQDDPSRTRQASVDLFGNPMIAANNSDASSACELWQNIGDRNPPHWPDACQISPPRFSCVGGFYTNEFEITLTHPDPEATIVYTVDGSDPDITLTNGFQYLYKNSYPVKPDQSFGAFMTNGVQSYLYHTPIRIADIAGKNNYLSGISTTAEYSPSYFPDERQEEAVVVRAAAFRRGLLPSRPVTHTYFLFTNTPVDRITVLSLVAQEDQLFGYNDGIMVAGRDCDEAREKNYDEVFSRYAPGNFTRRDEVAGNIELFEPGLSVASLNQGVGIRIHGDTARRLPLKNLRLYARPEYSKYVQFNYPFFTNGIPGAENDGVHAFNRLLLRSHGGGGPYNRDLITTMLMQPVYNGVSRAKPAIMFINGEFWGITSIRDRLDDYHFANQYSLDRDKITITYSTKEVLAGPPEELDELRGLISFMSHCDLDDPVNWQYVQSGMDIESFIHYLFMHIYFGKGDWYGTSHFGYWRTRGPEGAGAGDGRWRTYTWDWDYQSAEKPSQNWLKKAMNDFTPSVSALYSNLFRSSNFRNQFIIRAADLMNSTLLAKNVEEIINREYHSIAPFLDISYRRWRSHIAPDEVNKEYAIFGRERPDHLREQIIESLGAGTSYILSLRVRGKGAGSVSVNTIKEAAIKNGEDTVDWAGTYFSNVPVELIAHPYSGSTFAGWEVRQLLEDGSSGDIVSAIPDNKLSIVAMNGALIVATFSK